MPNDKGFLDMNQPMKKTQPASVPKRDAARHGDAHDFNTQGKITNNAGSDYADVARPNSGLHGNFAEKDAQLKYLLDRNKQGQVVKNYNATTEESRLHTYNIGQTAYNSRPIDEVYKPATSQNIPPSEAIVRSTLKKPDNDQETKSTVNITQKIK